ncbi:hypothetical protein ACFL4G_12110, partial [Thermodesulfobacteriota bacterium]
MLFGNNYKHVILTSVILYLSFIVIGCSSHKEEISPTPKLNQEPIKVLLSTLGGIPDGYRVIEKLSVTSECSSSKRARMQQERQNIDKLKEQASQLGADAICCVTHSEFEDYKSP